MSGYSPLLEASSKKNFTYGKIQEEREMNRQLKRELARLQDKRKVQQKEWKRRDEKGPPTPIETAEDLAIKSPKSSCKSPINSPKNNASSPKSPNSRRNSAAILNQFSDAVVDELLKKQA